MLTYEHSRHLSSIPSRLSWLFASKIPAGVKVQWSIEFDWNKPNQAEIFTLLQSSIPEAVKAECISRWERSKAALIEIVDFFSRNEINEVTMNIIPHVGWLFYSADECERMMTRIFRQNTLLKIGHFCK